MTTTPRSWPVRRATPADGDGIWPLVKDLAVPYTPTRPGFDESLHAVLADDDMLVLVAAREGRIGGYLLANRHRTFFRRRL